MSIKNVRVELPVELSIKPAELVTDKYLKQELKKRQTYLESSDLKRKTKYASTLVPEDKTQDKSLLIERAE